MKWLPWTLNLLWWGIEEGDSSTQPDHGDGAISIHLSTCRTECYSPKYSADQRRPIWHLTTGYICIYIYMYAQIEIDQEHHNLLQQGCWAWQQQSMAGNVQDFIASNMPGCLKSRWHQEVSDFEVEWDQNDYSVYIYKLYQKLRIG